MPGLCRRYVWTVLSRTPCQSCVCLPSCDGSEPIGEACLDTLELLLELSPHDLVCDFEQRLLVVSKRRPGLQPFAQHLFKSLLTLLVKPLLVVVALLPLGAFGTVSVRHVSADDNFPPNATDFGTFCFRR